MRRFVTYVTCVTAILSATAFGQLNGQVGIQTVGPVRVFTNSNVPSQASSCVIGGTCAIPNKGQSQHTLRYCLTPGTGTIADFIVRLEASDDGTVWSPVSDAGLKTTGCNYLPGAPSYYPMLRVNVLDFQCSGAGCVANGASYSVSYSASAAPGGGVGMGTVLSMRQPTLPAISSNSEQNATSFSGFLTVTNPGANTGVIEVRSFSTSTPFTRILDKVFVECSAACSFDIVVSNNNGTGCGLIGEQNLNSGSSVVSTVVNVPSCAGQPTVAATVYPPITIPANTLTAIDVSGLVIPPGAATDFMVRNSTALVGTMTVTLTEYQR